jgi:RimJ/RimL family protein N-acetyltransferase
VSGQDVPTRITARLVLRSFAPADQDRFAAMNADPRVMEYYPSPLSREQSDAIVARMAATWAERGFGLWALECRDDATFIGYAGLWPVPDEVPVSNRPAPCVEVGWRLAAHAWGHGFATEAAREAIGFGFAERALPEVVSFTAVANRRSRAVMERLGMVRDVLGDFEHPALHEGHRLSKHVLYRLPSPHSPSRLAHP